ncbi:MAG TPA: hypothetical protein DCQ93_06575 [Bacteroidetes bacterium]|nr:hypothetical protein [Bacteroidota bacterium]
MKGVANILASVAILSVLAIGGFVVYNKFFSINNKDQALKYLKEKLTLTNPASLDNLGEEYLIAWARALRLEKNSFTLKDSTKKFSTKTGKAL